MTFHAVDPIVAMIATAAAGTVAIAQDLPIAPTEVGIVTVLLGAGIWAAKTAEKYLSRLVDAIDKNTAEQSKVSSDIRLLMQQTDESRRGAEDKSRQILDKLSDLPDRVADEIKRSKLA